MKKFILSVGVMFLTLSMTSTTPAFGASEKAENKPPAICYILEVTYGYISPYHYPSNEVRSKKAYGLFVGKSIIAESEDKTGYS